MTYLNDDNEWVVAVFAYKYRFRLFMTWLLIWLSYIVEKLCTCNYQIVVNYIKLTVKAFSDDLWNHNELEVAYLRMGQTFWIASLYKFINCALHTEQFLLILSDLDLGSQ